MSVAIVLPTRLAIRTIKTLQRAGYFVYRTYGRRRVLTVVGRARTNAVEMPRRSGVEEIFRFGERPQ